MSLHLLVTGLCRSGLPWFNTWSVIERDSLYLVVLGLYLVMLLATLLVVALVLLLERSSYYLSMHK